MRTESLAMSSLVAFKAFLSHRYKSPEVNEYFFEVFEPCAAIEFDVDAANGPTNVTRLERMMRSSDGFIAIYPFVAEHADRPTVADLRAASTYFRLEIGLASRARKPMLIFADRRFGAALAPPSSAAFVEFDYRELIGGGLSPNRARFREEFERFVKRVQAGMAYDITRSTLWRTNRVGLLLPTASAYSPEVADRLQDLIVDFGGEVIRIPWPRSIDARFTAAIDACDFIVTDIGVGAEFDAVPAFLEGWCVPLLRLRHLKGNGDPVPSPLEVTLYGSYEVGYPKDVVRWSSADGLLQDVTGRLTRIHQEPRLIATTAQARKYFRTAAPRPERVFISYSGADAASVAPIVEAFRRRFQQVFDYKDGESIRGGRPWLEEIFDSLERSALAVLLVSPAYLASQNCVHEAEQAIASRDDRKLQVLPVKLSASSSAMPNWLQRLQAVRYLNDPSPLVEAAIALLPEQTRPADGSAAL
jgi:hypothetical protein